jgi:lysylphosphatidylglycerol synthetase-like protein (DUF2156 family)
MCLCGFVGTVRRMVVMSASHVCAMRRCLAFARLVILCRFFLMSCCVFVMFRRLVKMFSCLFRHNLLPVSSWIPDCYHSSAQHMCQALSLAVG